jgi:hypothetical protein
MASSANQLSPTNPKKGWFSIGVLCLIITLYAYSFKLEISTLSLIAENVISLKIKPVVIPLIVMKPVFLYSSTEFIKECMVIYQRNRCEGGYLLL